MNYIGNTCPGCLQEIKEDEDIVVCPECGTPQHRTCWEKENKCVNSYKHDEAFQWKSQTPEVKVAPMAKKAETVPCPNCGCENPVGTAVCENCGMKFTIFGMNVVDAMHNEEMKNTNTNSDIPPYEAPFTLGEGEGFDYSGLQGEPPTPGQVENMLTDILSGNGEESTDGRINLGGPFPLSDEIDGVRTNTVGNFIGSNALSYISKFRKLQAGKKLSFNFASFFFAPYWFFYRKLFVPGIIFMTAFLAISIISVPFLTEASDALLQLMPTIEAAGDAAISPEELTEIYNNLLAQILPLMAPMFAFSFINFVLHLVAGFIANPLYKKYVITNAGTAERMNDMRIAIAHIVKTGGCSILYALIAFGANELISIFVSFLL